MSVNIFGSSKQVSGGPGQKGQPGIGFKILDNEGNYDIDSKRLANVDQPISDNDAVTMVYVDKAISKQEANLLRIKSRFKWYSSQISKISSLVQDIPRNLDKTKSEVDHLQSFCERMDNRIDDISEECVTQEYFTNSMVANSKMLTDLEKNDNELNNQLNNVQKRLDVLSEFEEKINTTSERVDASQKAIIEDLNALNKLEKKVDSLSTEIRKNTTFIQAIYGKMHDLENK